MTFPLPCPPLPPGFDEKESEILRKCWKDALDDALQFKLRGNRSGRVLPEFKIHRGKVRAASTGRVMDGVEGE